MKVVVLNELGPLKESMTKQRDRLQGHVDDDEAIPPNFGSIFPSSNT